MPENPANPESERIMGNFRTIWFCKACLFSSLNETKVQNHREIHGHTEFDTDTMLTRDGADVPSTFTLLHESEQ